MRKSDAMRIINILEIELKNVSKSLADTIEETVSLQEHNVNLKSDVKSIFNMNADTVRINESLNRTIDVLEEKIRVADNNFNWLYGKVSSQNGNTFAEMEAKIKDQELEIARLSELVNANTEAANKFDKIRDIIEADRKVIEDENFADNLYHVFIDGKQI